MYVALSSLLWWYLLSLCCLCSAGWATDNHPQVQTHSSCFVHNCQSRGMCVFSKLVLSNPIVNWWDCIIICLCDFPETLVESLCLDVPLCLFIYIYGVNHLRGRDIVMRQARNRLEVWYPYILESCGVHPRNTSGVTEDFTWASHC
jgi:hypothetical protein